MEALAKTPMPVISALAGIIFLVLSLGGLEPLKVLQVTLPRISDSQRWPARIFGAVLLICGFVLTGYDKKDDFAPEASKLPVQVFVNVPTLPAQAEQAIMTIYKLPSEKVIDNSSVPVARYSGQNTELTEQEKSAVLELVSVANLAETYSLTLSDMQYAGIVYAGDALSEITTMIDEMSSNGLYYVPLFDTDRSYYTDIRQLDDTTIQVDGCEVWSGDYYFIADNSYFQSDEPQLIPQTMTIRYLDTSWYITNITFYDTLAFCGSSY